MNYETVIFTLIGVVFGGVFGLLGHWINNRHAMSRDYYRAAVELAKEDYAAMIRMTENTELKVLPIETFYTYYVKYFNIIRKKKFKLEDLDQLAIYKEEIIAYYNKRFNTAAQHTGKNILPSPNLHQ